MYREYKIIVMDRSTVDSITRFGSKLGFEFRKDWKNGHRGSKFSNKSTQYVFKEQERDKEGVLGFIKSEHNYFGCVAFIYFMGS